MNSGLGLNIIIPEHLRGPVTEAQRNEFRGVNILEREDDEMPTDRIRRTGSNNNNNTNTNRPAAVNSSRGRTTSRRAASSGSLSRREPKHPHSSSSSSSSLHHPSFNPFTSQQSPQQYNPFTSQQSPPQFNQFNPFTTHSFTPTQQPTPQPTPQPIQQQVPSFTIYYDINDGYGPMDTSLDDVIFLDAEYYWYPIVF